MEKKEIRQTHDLLSVHGKHIDLPEVPFYSQPYNSYCMLMEKVPDHLMEIFPEINLAISNMASKFCTNRETNETFKKMLFNRELIKIKTDGLQKKNALD